MITTLIFDFGGVIIDLDRQRCIDAFEQIGVPNTDKMLNNYLQSGIFAQLENGTIEPADFYNEIRRLSPQTLTNNDINRAYYEYLVDIPREKMDMLLRLRQKFRILLLSNTNAIHFPFCERYFEYENHTIDDFFDAKYCSYKLKMSKPDPKFFKFMLENEQILPQNCLFFDDGERNCNIANSLDINAILTPERANVHFFEKNIEKYLVNSK